MPPSNHNPSRENVFDLADRQLDGSLDAIDGQALERMLAEDATLRRAYLEYLLLHGQLSLTQPAIHAQAQVAPMPVTLPTASGRVASELVTANVVKLRRVAAAAVAALVLLAVGFVVTRDVPVVDPRLSEVHLLDIHYQTRLLPLPVVGTLQNLGAERASTDPTNEGTITHLPKTLRVRAGEQQFISASGARVRTQGPTLFGISSAHEGTLYSGSIQALLPRTQDKFAVRVGDVRVMGGGGGDFQVTRLDQHHLWVKADRGEVQIETRDRLPRYWWNFDDRAASNVGKSKIELGAAATMVEGIVGRHAIAFDNTRDAFVQLPGGTSSTVGSGGLSCGDAITIEAMIVSKWSGEYLDYDEIFRKDDSEYRTLLSFQNDGGHAFDDPPVPRGPVLAFGLHLEGHGYRELDMPLDGEQGRPTVGEIADSEPHHVVATYDSASGEKRLYVDGTLRFEQVYPRGTLIVCGGPEPAQIGNHRGVEPFHGVIDEVAFYDLALSAEEVADHWQNARLGVNYFGPTQGNTPNAPSATSTTLRDGEELTLELPAPGDTGSMY